MASSGVPSWNTMPGRRVMVNDGEVLVRRDRLGQVRLHPARGVHDGDGVEDGAAVEEAALVPARRRGVEAALLGVDAEGERTALAPVSAVETPFRPGPLVWAAPASPSSPPSDGGPGAQCESTGHERPTIK